MSMSSRYTTIERASFRYRLKLEFEDIKLQRIMAERTKEKLRQELLNEETLRWYHFKNKIENQREIARMRYGNIPEDMVRYLKPKDEYERQLENAKEEAELELEEQRLYMAATTMPLPDVDKYLGAMEEIPTTSQNSDTEREETPRYGLFVPGHQNSSKHSDKSKK
ncbi:uncharacterized protein LOC111068691 [Drosophila obscura]|uniref:uncharacterized protein LOC111068691 n=1 Tax=Drosophila obscura TaxID=7282 RepID=UPI001BB23E9A|nr:uncharacterized protein LOC111068691 [Drosophila obscura]XP_022214054.2 uncharacterized protein LOC111068691 [Drosophila obscura]XP_022214055.2 uncharacterized protein LOC111068691 [Drosophila obscura]XP_022214057.2 uncharacterized protein LOC111068691 [Drosophila obscura]